MVTQGYHSNGGFRQTPLTLTHVILIKGGGLEPALEIYLLTKQKKSTA